MLCEALQSIQAGYRSAIRVLTQALKLHVQCQQQWSVGCYMCMLHGIQGLAAYPTLAETVSPSCKIISYMSGPIASTRWQDTTCAELIWGTGHNAFAYQEGSGCVASVPYCGARADETIEHVASRCCMWV
jgi:hypothetical protein